MGPDKPSTMPKKAKKKSRKKASKDDKKIMVVERGVLFAPSQKNLFEGFRPAHEVNYEKIILDRFTAMRRGDAEKDPGYKQPIPYMLIVNTVTGKVFSYQRAEKEHDEERLRGHWSWGIGGHVDENFGTRNPLKNNLLRELDEEVYLPLGTSLKMRILGYINYESDEVSQVHFGLLYVVQVNRDVKARASEINKKTARFRTVGELEKICDSKDHTVEAWSGIALRPLREYLEEQGS